MSQKFIDLINTEVGRLSIRKKSTQGSWFIQCPYHQDGTPSGGINIDPAKKVPLGWFSCFGCAASKPWNELAETLGLRKYKGRSNGKLDADDFLDPSLLAKELLEDEEEESISTKDLEFFDFQIDEWRGFKVSFLEKVGAKFAYHDKSGEFLVWFPCMIKGKLEGFVSAKLEKVEGSTSYVNAPGQWSKTKGLLFYDYAIAMMKRKGLKTLVVCEGPRDALRCLRYGIPAVCILGIKSWSDDKRLLFEEAEVDLVIIFMDGDKAGKMATKVLRKAFKDIVSTKYINMWKYEKGWDPGNCPTRFHRQVKNALV